MQAALLYSQQLHLPQLSRSLCLQTRQMQEAMKSASSTDGLKLKATIWKRAFDFEKALTPTAARALLQVQLATSEHEHMAALLDKAQSQPLTTTEEEEMDAYEQLGALIGILHSKARQALKQRRSQA